MRRPLIHAKARILADTLASNSNETSAAEAAARATAHLQGGRFAEAEAAAREALAERADDADALYALAVALRYQARERDALDTLARLKAARPGFGRADQEEGHARRALDDPEGAARAYEAAVRANPGLLASWRALSQLYASAGRTDAATNARAQAERLAKLPRELLSVTSFIAEGRLYKAEQLCRDFLQRTPHNVEAMRLLARIGMKLNVLDDAEFLLESALEFDPDNRLARIDYVEALSRRQKYARALEEAEKVRDAAPNNPATQMLHANALTAVGRYDDAIAAFDQLRDAAHDRAQVDMARGHALKTIGRHDDAVAAYRAAYAERPDLGDAHWSLANLKTYRFTDDEIAAMTREEARDGVDVDDRIHLCFALGKAHEDREETDTAFAFYERGNRLKTKRVRYSADRMDVEFARQKEVCTPELFAAKSGMGCTAPDPIFIVGLPRAGSTLIEQILASHSKVDGTLELPNVLALAHRLGGRRRREDEPRYPAILNDLTADQLAKFGAAYLEDTRVYREDAPFFTDKMPNNFRHIGLIKLMLPNAKIIDARRHPLACCFSGFKQLFAEGQEFTYGLEEIGRYYRGYIELMAHWDAVLPGAILRVQHEDVVADLEGQVRRILDFCGLAFEPACLDFHKTERAVRTASSEQVRRPIDAAGVEQWRAFEAHFDPLKDALGPALDGYR